MLYNANYKISLKEYIKYLSILDKNYIRRLLRIILLFKKILFKEIYIHRFKC